MDRFNSLFDSQFVYALGWTIVHSFWQSLLVFMLLGLCLLVSQRARPETRYWLSVSALLCCLIISIKTFVYCYQDVVQASQLLAQLQNTLQTPQIQNWWVSTFKTINPWLDTIVLLWCVGFIIQGLRYVYDIVRTHNLKSQSVSDLPSDWNKRLQGLALKLGVTKTVFFKHSTKVNVPSVIGHFKPIILLPLGILTQLPQAQIEAIVLHELAHVKRHDYLINIVLCLIKVLFFFNPFVLAISKRISIERESICDDMAVKACGDPLTFANSLSQFADVTSISQSAMAANKDKYLLLDRVKRLFPIRGKLSTTTERLIALMCTALLGLTLNVNAKNQPVPATFESIPIQQTPTEISTEQDTYSNTTGETSSYDTLFTKPNVSTDDSSNQSGTTNKTIEARGSTDNLTITGNATQPTDQNIESQLEKHAIFFEKPQQETSVKPQTTMLLTQNSSIDSSGAARSYIKSEIKNVKENKETIQTSQQLAGRVYATTSKFKSFTLESPQALDNIEQIIFAPISTSDTQFSEGSRKWRNVISEYFSEVQNHKPRVLSLNKKGHAMADFTDMNSTLIAQIRIKDVKLLANRKNEASNTKSTQSSTSNPSLTDANIMSSIMESEVTEALNSKADLTKTKFILEVITQVVFVDAISYKYVGYGIKKIWLDSTNVEPSLLTLARHEESPPSYRTKAERSADIIKNAWDILISHVQNDVYQVATAIKKQELKLTLRAKLESLPTKNPNVNRHLASQYFSIKNSEFEDFIISSPDSLNDFKNATYKPIVIDQVQLKSKYLGWKQRVSVTLSNLTKQPKSTYILATNILDTAEQNTPMNKQSLLVQIDIKTMELYSRSANRTYRKASEVASGSSRYNRGSNATGTGNRPSKDDVGGATARTGTLVMPRAFNSNLYLRGQFDITLLDPQTHQVLGHVVSVTAVSPNHSVYKKLAEQINDQKLDITQENILLIALFKKVKTHLHAELLQIQQGNVTTSPVELTAEQSQVLSGHLLVKKT